MQQWVHQEVGAILSEDSFVNNMFYRLADKLCRRESNCWQCQTPKVATGTRLSEEQLIKEVNHKKYYKNGFPSPLMENPFIVFHFF